MSQTIQQRRAKFAMDRINDLLALEGNEQFTQEQQKNFNSYASSLPAMIHTNGLGQALAFCRTKGSNRGLAESEAKKRSYNALHGMVSDWICKESRIYAGYENQEVLKAITGEDMQHYQLAQTETLMLMSWVKKFAKAFLADEETAS